MPIRRLAGDRSRVHIVNKPKGKESLGITHNASNTGLSCIMVEAKTGDKIPAFESNYKGETQTAIEEWKKKWERPVVTYGVTNESKHFPNSSIEMRAMTVALRVWQLRIKDIKFKRIYDTTTNTPDIPLTFIDAENDKLFSERPGVLAYAYFPTDSPIGGDVTFNDSYNWSLDGNPIPAWKVDPIHYTKDSPVKMKSYNMVHTMIHELGHGIGLRHDPHNNASVMYPYYNGKVELSASDVRRIQSFYGERKLHPRWVRYFRDRLLRGLVR